MEIILLSKDTTAYNQQAADLLQKIWPDSYADCAEEEIAGCLEAGKIALAMVDGETLCGFVGAMPQYGVTGWELHPLAVSEEYRWQGIGAKLCMALESRLKERGCLTIYLGSDDVDGATTLSHTNLFENTFAKISEIKNIKQHAYEFYEKIGYKIVGVIPDANGIGKPDIWLAKSLVYTAK